jgi:hypothetical protein
MERLANYLMNRSLGSSFSAADKVPNRWEWKLGNDIKLLLDCARASVPADTDGIHYFSGRGYKQPPRLTDVPR